MVCLSPHRVHHPEQSTLRPSYAMLPFGAMKTTKLLVQLMAKRNLNLPHHAGLVLLVLLVLLATRFWASDLIKSQSQAVQEHVQQATPWPSISMDYKSVYHSHPSQSGHSSRLSDQPFGMP